MKKTLIFLAFTGIFTLSCNSSSDKKDNGLQEVRLDEKTSNADIVRLPISADGKMDTANMAKIVFETSTHDFGSITEGEVIKHIFTFKNVGAVPLVISDIQTSCGCTVPEWQRAPIAVGGSSEVRVQFNSEGKNGVQEKPIRVIANTLPNETVLMLSGNVTPK
ncbi:MAG: DUF1573 domain-containing protein [Saprospiraceae bacterium]|nr:DUF1573 domain-containing protein [Saprospiraceae bacterium]